MVYAMPFGSPALIIILKIRCYYVWHCPTHLDGLDDVVRDEVKAGMADPVLHVLLPVESIQISGHFAATP